MQVLPFNGEKRDLTKKSKQVRKEGRIPAVIYGPDVLEHFTVTHNEVKKLIFTPDFKLGEVSIDGSAHKCIVKDIQWHPVTDEIRHIDFLALKEGTQISVELPVKFKGVSPGVKEGGALMQTMRRVKVKVDPKYLVDELFVDISELQLGDAVRVKDIELPENLELMVSEAIPVATVEVPRALKSLEAEEADAAAAAEGAEGAEGADGAAPAEGDAAKAE